MAAVAFACVQRVLVAVVWATSPVGRLTASVRTLRLLSGRVIESVKFGLAFATPELTLPVKVGAKVEPVAQLVSVV